MFPTCLKGFAQYILFFASLFLFSHSVFCFLGFELISMDRESRYRLGSVLALPMKSFLFTEARQGRSVSLRGMTSCAGLKTIIVKVFIPGADKETHRGLFCFW